MEQNREEIESCIYIIEHTSEEIKYSSLILHRCEIPGYGDSVCTKAKLLLPNFQSCFFASSFRTWRTQESMELAESPLLVPASARSAATVLLGGWHGGTGGSVASRQPPCLLCWCARYSRSVWPVEGDAGTCGRTLPKPHGRAPPSLGTRTPRPAGWRRDLPAAAWRKPAPRRCSRCAQEAAPPRWFFRHCRRRKPATGCSRVGDLG